MQTLPGLRNSSPYITIQGCVHQPVGTHCSFCVPHGIHHFGSLPQIGGVFSHFKIVTLRKLLPMPIKTGVVSLVLLLFSFSVIAQKKQVTEFIRGGILLVKLSNGFSTGFRSATPDLYSGGMALSPQVTVITNRLRVGANAGFVYNNKCISGLFGPAAALKLADLRTKKPMALAFGNLQLLAEANWGTHRQRMAGGGIGLELLQKIQLGITAQRDYHLNNWWFQSFIAYQFNKTPKIKPQFE